MTLSNVIDISEDGLFETMSSYYQSYKYWKAEKNPIYRTAAEKEIARYNYLKNSVLVSQ